MSFPCTSCGLCCRVLPSLIPEFPYKIMADGTCEKLVNGLCSVYEDRPRVCNIEQVADDYYPNVPKKVVYYENAKRCNENIIAHSLGEKYLIDLKQFEK